MTRTAKKTIVNVSLTEAQQAANSYASANIKMDKLTAEMNEKLTAVREKYEPQITEITESMAEQVDVLEAFAKSTRHNWDAKSAELANCIIGFRTNPPSLTKKKGITWDTVVALMQNNRLLKPFIRIKKDVDKAALLKAQTDAKLVKQMEAVGMLIEQEEQFFVDVKKEKAA